MSSPSYEPRHPVKTEFVSVRGLRYAVHQWGRQDAPALFGLHGWADTGRSFQFLADKLADDFRLIAPDWRGFGDTDKALAGYWFPDYLADFDALVEHYSPEEPLSVLGHSMGANIACLYCGTRPDRIRNFINLEGLGLEPRPAHEAPGRYAQWLDEQRVEQSVRSFPDLDALSEYLRGRDSRLPEDRAQFIARIWSREGPQGERVLKLDPNHKRVNPVLYRHEEFRAFLGAITARKLLLVGRESWLHERFSDPGIRAELDELMGEYESAVIEGAGHMLHHDAPERVADCVRTFLAKDSTAP